MNTTTTTTDAGFDRLPAGVHLPADLAEEDGRAVLTALAARYGWAYAIWDRHDALYELVANRDGVLRRQLTDDEWRRVVDSAAWDNLPGFAYSQITEADQLGDAVLEAGLECPWDRRLAR